MTDFQISDLKIGAVMHGYLAWQTPGYLHLEGFTQQGLEGIAAYMLSRHGLILRIEPRPQLDGNVT